MTDLVMPTTLVRLMYRMSNVRRYRTDPVPDDILDDLLLAFSYAPSMANTQPWEVVVLSKTEDKALLVGATLDPLLSPDSRGGQAWVADAPVVLVICLDLKRSRVRLGPAGDLFAFEDAAMAVQNLRLAALAHGLHSAFVRELDPEALKSTLRLPWYVRPMGLVTLGYAAEDVDEELPPRLAIAEFVHRERW